VNSSRSARGADPSPTVIDLFAGCGGGSLGFTQAGFRPVAAVEIDGDAADAYQGNVGLRPVVDDIRHVDGESLLKSAGLKVGECTLLFGCPPCQSFTILRRGARLTKTDRARNALPREYVRLVEEIRPRHLAFENVPGMVEGRWRPQFDQLLSELTRVGYRHVWRVMDAAEFGVPQHRRRVLVVASRVAVPRLPEATHSDDDDSGLLPPATVRSAIGALRPLSAGEQDSADPYHRARRHSDVALRRLHAVPEGGGRKDLPSDLQLACHKDHDGHYDIYGRMWWDRPAPTLTSGCTNVTRGRFGHPEQHRAITLREAMTLQTFPETAVLRGTGEAMALQVGNAVPPLLARRIGETVLAMEGTSRRSTRRLASGSPASGAANSLKRHQDALKVRDVRALDQDSDLNVSSHTGGGEVGRPDVAPQGVR
jgi:DNA (cytosine-5)-methyltransferase 1